MRRERPGHEPPAAAGPMTLAPVLTVMAVVAVVAVVTAATLVALPSASAAWATEGADASNTGRVAASYEPSLDGTDARSVGRSIVQPIEGPASLALVGTLAGKLVALDVHADVVWELDVGGPVRAPPTWTGELIVVVPTSNEAVAVTPDGLVAWRLPIDNTRDADVVRLAAPKVLSNGDVVVADLAGSVQRVTPTGDVVWSHSMGERQAVESTPAITANGDVVVAAFEPGTEGRGTLARLAGGTGEPVWEEALGSQVVGGLVIAGDKVLVPLRDGDALEARLVSNGKRQWSRAFDDHLTAAPSVHEGLALVGDLRGVVRAVRISNGEPAWRFSPMQEGLGPGGIVGGDIALSVADAIAIDGKGRAWVPYWAVDLTGGFPPTDSKSSPFYILDAATGDVLDQDRLPKAAHGPALHATGVWVGSDDGLARSWPKAGQLHAHAVNKGDGITLILNTDQTGGWSVTWSDGERDEGPGAPPTIASRDATPGTYTATVRVGELTTEVSVEVPAHEPNTGPMPDPLTPEAGDDDGDADRNGDGEGAEDGNGAPLVGTAPLVLALLAAAGLAAMRRRRRA